MAYRTNHVVDSIEVVDLAADDSYVEKLNKLTIPDEIEEDQAPLIYHIDDDGDDESEGEDFVRLVTPNEQSRIERRDASDGFSTTTGRHYIQAAQHLGFTIKTGSDVELEDEEFFRVVKLYLDEDDDVQIQGILFVRTRLVQNYMPKKCNELCAIITARADSGARLPEIDTYLVTRPLTTVICPRRIILTNMLFPAHSFREQSKCYPNWQAVQENAELVCRYKYIEFCDTVTCKVPSQALVRLRKHECDIGVTDAQLMQTWRKPKGLMRVPHQPKASNKRKQIDLTADESEVEETTSRYDQTVKRINRFGVYEKHSVGTVTERFTPNQGVPSQPRTSSKYPRVPMHRAGAALNSKIYTFGDICAGAGGATSAAQRAELAVNFALDFAPDPCTTLRLNFPDAKVLNMDIYDFCNPEFRLKTYMKVDVLHISFPCQVYSLAHTHAGKDDERNEATGYSVMPLLEKCRPRIVTFEQSPNITKQHHASFEALVHQITDMGYSVRWKIVNFADTGNAQSRNRLWMFATCPGQPLPAFPAATHGTARDLKPYTTINDILRQVPKHVAPHMTETVIRKNTSDFMPYNGDRPLRGAITCGGGERNLHPNGRRPFNNQELAQLQGFSAKHGFSGGKSSIMRQIGNAVPGKAATPFFKEVVKALKKFDEEVENDQNQVIEID